MNHELKIWPQYFERVRDGSKTFEVRENDRGFQSGDTVTLCEWDPEINRENKFTNSEPITFKIGYVLPIDGNRVVFSLLEIKE